MKETTVLNNISKLIDKINYKSIYIEINTDTQKYTLEKQNKRAIGFSTKKKEGDTNGKKGKKNKIQ